MSVKDAGALAEVVVPLGLVPVDGHVFAAHLCQDKDNLCSDAVGSASKIIIF